MLPRDGLDWVVEDLAHQIPLLDAQRSGIELYGAPRLSAFELFAPNEIALSRIVSELFDPAGVHGQGPLFLNALLEAIAQPRVGVRDSVSVNREVFTETGRRIDIVIETPRVLVGIENKPWAGQQRDQLSDYLKELERRAGGKSFVLVFLSDQEEASAKGQVVRMPYQPVPAACSLYAVLGSIASSIRAPRTRAFVDDFMGYIDENFGKSEMTKESNTPYLQAVHVKFEQGPAERKAIAAILLSSQSLHLRVLDEIGDFLLRKVRQQVANDFFIEDNLSLSNALAQKWTPWALRRGAWPVNSGIFLDADKNNYRDIYFGVRAPDPESHEVNEFPDTSCPGRSKLESLQERFTGGRKSAWCPWWKYCATSFWDQGFAAELVLQSPTSQIDNHPEIQDLSQHFVELAKVVDELFR